LRYQFTVDGLIYEVSVSRTNDIQLAIVGGASPTFEPKYDPFDWEYIPRVTQDIGTMRYPIRVTRTALRQIENWIGGQRPGYFSFLAETESRRSLYRRVAGNLAARFPYELTEQDGRFFFFRHTVNDRGVA